MKNVFVFFVLLFVSAQSFARTVNISKDYDLVDDLAGCKVYYLRSNDNWSGTNLFLTKCPNSTTTTSTTGKNPVRTTHVEKEVSADNDYVIVNGVKYYKAK